MLILVSTINIDNKFQLVDSLLDKSIPIFEPVKKSIDSGYQDLDSINLDLDLSRLSRPDFNHQHYAEINLIINCNWQKIKRFIFQETFHPTVIRTIMPTASVRH